MTWQSVLFEGLGTLGQSLSLGHNHLLGQTIGRAIWYLVPQRRQLAINAIMHHLDLNSAQARRLAYLNFKHIGCSFSEILLNKKVDLRFAREHFLNQDPELFSSMAAQKRSIVAVTGHLGAWELLAGILRLNFSERTSQIIMQKGKNRDWDQFIVHYRQHPGVDILHNKKSSRQIMRCLKNNGISSFLVDHNCGRRKALFLPFLKKYAAVNMGPAFLAVKAEALLWPIFLLRQKNHKYQIISFKPLDTRTLSGNKEEKIVQAASFYTRTVESMVKAYPEQWFWMHKRWKKQPKSDTDLRHARLAEQFNAAD
jgi:KDO2-lipid IV(A) lauroyltransferase